MVKKQFEQRKRKIIKETTSVLALSGLSHSRVERVGILSYSNHKYQEVFALFGSNVACFEAGVQPI